MDVIFNNQELVVTALSLVITWLITLFWKKSVDRTALIATLNQILDLAQDIANGSDTAELDNEAKKKLAIEMAETKLPPKKKKLIQKIFGSLGGAVEFVWKNRTMLVPAAIKLVKVVI